ncbi:hypothetical protein MADA3029_1140032 [Vibrio nigripulchritudo MADA3029]|uniref:Uncharacterized protein n=1 Tax=Vibrio nigripulchritudo TaxID=28173 RepID=U4K8I6_9VIBR|nr:hypothetical protein VIBNIMADA3020_10033 [Vibrio nigripulchritudo MADA3020]CCN54432.1 hypothetical protein VIBNIMADA3021_550032 [Vibrio nigripulchritudo MADA3021]CCN57482.1 hypothetical protein MADA3029_1140032 [Vibrio nigripulchritudo MADA3029]CCN84814.1 hypothetical protein VIBNIBLFn1_870141 [Vibrio nigripulchritudo BLFn1]CCN87693.1 hypothetical protein VIBNISFn27_170033 [Vibrio nigripulchritudo SFn27]CCN95811.1 hypothetical protein VIBNIENn2_630140 [Vibrio nigripulchritudo ENn2]CCO38969
MRPVPLFYPKSEFPDVGLKEKHTRIGLLLESTREGSHDVIYDSSGRRRPGYGEPDQP